MKSGSADSFRSAAELPDRDDAPALGTNPETPAPMTEEERAARWLYADDDCGIWLDDPGPHGGDCTKECHTCRRCLQDQYSKKAARLLAELRRHRASPSTAAGGWQAIETAPKDGTFIIGGRAEKRSKMMWWETQSGGGGRWLIDDGDFSPAKPQPTHWWPVPEFMK